MSENAVPEEFQRLRTRPRFAWPTIVLMFACLAAIFFSWGGVLAGTLPLWAGCAINCVAMYCLFAPIHDAIHRSMGRDNRFNDLCMRLILLPIVPFSNGRLLRVMHMQHHRFANDPENDPDHWPMTAPLKMWWIWFAWDFHYLIYYLRRKERFRDIDVGTPLRDTILVWTGAFALGWFHPLEVILLWFVPTRLMAWLVAGVFMYLPHWPHDVRHDSDPWQATHIRRGAEWLLTPLFLWQNYHLVHHLYPTVPFYRYRRLWEARRAWHEAHDFSQVSAFRLRPERLLRARAKEEGEISGRRGSRAAGDPAAAFPPRG